MLDSVGCGHGLRSMWAPIPFHVGRHYGVVDTDSADLGIGFGGAGQRECCPAGFRHQGFAACACSHCFSIRVTLVRSGSQ